MHNRLFCLTEIKNKTKAITTAKQEELCGMGKFSKQKQGTWDASDKKEQCRLVKTELLCLTVLIGKEKKKKPNFLFY